MSQSTSITSINWQHWLDRWDAQQVGYLPQREARFTAMLEVLATLLPAEFVAVDLACGPGAISQRILTRFPQARCIAVDLDPVLLAIGQGVLGNGGGRLRWVEADLMTVDFGSLLKEPVDAVLTTTALHWLPSERLLQVYHQLGQWIRPGGVFLNGDNIPFTPHLKTFQGISQTLRDQQEAEAFQSRGVESWDQWWHAIEQEPELQPLLQERERRLGGRKQDLKEPILDLHEAGLKDAEFAEVGVIWQRMDDRILMALR